MAFTKATIDIEPNAGIGQGDQIECMFNPTEFTVTKGATWAPRDVQGKGQPEMRFVSTTSGSFDLSLVFDTTESGTSVTEHTDLLLRLVEPSANLPSADAVAKRPPFVWFSWGRWKSFKAIVTNVAVNYTYFSADGSPLRATANVSFTQPEEDEAWPPQNPTSHTPMPHRIHRVQRGETLDRVAATYYSDPTDWRRIAETNDISDPIRLPAGALLIVPKRGALDG
jgi:hypothetical protein